MQKKERQSNVSGLKSELIITQRCYTKRTLTYDVVFWTKGVYHRLVPVTSEPLDDYLHERPPFARFLSNIPLIRVNIAY